MFKKVLIANRGEIAVRIIRACHELGVASVAVFSEADVGTLPTRLADEAYLIGPAAPTTSYLLGERIVAVARQAGCDAIHPGYGFLAENGDFAEAVAVAGLTFIGPSPAAIRLMGSKTAARSLMQQAGVPVLPGYHARPGDNDDTLSQAAAQIGYPLLVKATAGGGGKGMRLVETASALPEALASARREAQKAFGDDTIFLEKYIARPHHIEFQVFGDSFGQIVHLFERECSIQRRHQKIIEESPSPLLDEPLRQRIAQAALAAAQAVDYVNAGTVEFLVDDQANFYFLEMNTRLQVEHPVTELVTGLDLVCWQLRVAAGERLPWLQAELTRRGHAIECRLYAEDPAHGFLPDTGPVLRLVEPAGPGLRFDTGLTEGDTITHHYDPLLAKLIVLAEDRPAAVQKMRWALQQTVVLGPTTNLPFLRALLDHPTFAQGDTATDFVERHFPAWQPALPPPDMALIATALAEMLTGPTSPAEALDALNPTADPYSPWARLGQFRLGQ